MKKRLKKKTKPSPAPMQERTIRVIVNETPTPKFLNHLVVKGA